MGVECSNVLFEVGSDYYIAVIWVYLTYCDYDIDIGINNVARYS